MSRSARQKLRRGILIVALCCSVFGTVSVFAQSAVDRFTGTAQKVGDWQATTILAAVAIISLLAVVAMAKFILERDKEDRQLFLTALREASEASKWCRERSGK